jgi:protein-disulfide isomerase
VVLIIFPADPPEPLRVGLAAFQEQLVSFADQGAEVLGISSAPAESLVALAEALELRFPLLAGATADLLASFGALGEAGRVLPVVYALDEDHTVRSVYGAEHYPNLPNPAAVVRSLRRLNAAPRPAPVSRDDWQLGDIRAPVVLIEYSDYQCSHCMALHKALKELLSTCDDRLLVVHRHLPLRASHPLAQMASEAAEAAGAQGRFWDMHDRLFSAEGVLDREQLIAYARDVGLDVARFTADLDSRAYQEAVNEDFRRAVACGIKLPPTLFINGVLYEGAPTAEALTAFIGRLLR